MVSAVAIVRMGNGTSTACVVMMRVRRSENTPRLRGGKGRWCNPGELDDHKEGCQHADKAT